MYVTRRKRLQWSRIVFFVTGVFLCCVYQLSLRSRRSNLEPWYEQIDGDLDMGTAETIIVIDMWERGMSTVSAGRKEEDLTESISTRTTTATTTTARTTSTTTLPTTTSTSTPITPTIPPEGSTSTYPNHRHCIYVDPEPLKPTPAPTAPSPTTISASISPTTLPSVPNTTASIPEGMPHMKGEYPEDLFSVEQRRQGWVILHIFGMIYMFVSLAIVCDEFFVPALGVIIQKLKISDDVAGATFMAAGGSAPELFTSLIGVFISHSNVGIGTIVGSAVFNILFVIGMCALFSREMLHLTWWPLFRDVSFYILDLIMLIIFFLDNTIMWWESIMLLSGYISYVLFMKFNVQIEYAFKTQLNKHKSIVKVIAVEESEKVTYSEREFLLISLEHPKDCEPLVDHNEVEFAEDGGSPGAGSSHENPDDKNRLKPKPALQRGGSSASLHNSTMRSTIFQLMIHTLDPLGEVKFKDKAEILNNMARGKVESKAKDKQDDGNKSDQPSGAPTEPSTSQPPANDEEKAEQGEKDKEAGGSGGSDGSDSNDEDSSEDDSDDDSEDEDEEEEEEVEEPLSLGWPDTRRKQATYLFLLPIVFPLWLTIPDTRNPTSRKYFVMTFLGSIMWIAIFSYLMVWWAHQVGETIGISEEIMGLTILAAGTSIPDLITSVIVARKGLGDMAVSSSVGSNIFDITMGLPLPWLLYSMFNGLAPVAVSSNGLFCAIVLLFLMLLFVILSIAVCKWKMNKMLGFTMFMLYFVFLVLSVMLEDRIIVCPVSI